MRHTIKHGNIETNKILRIVFFVLGLVCLGVGFTGLILPVIPGAIFVLFSTYFFARSSNRVHRFLLNNRIFGKHLQAFANGEEIPLATKFVGIGLLVLSIGACIYFYKGSSPDVFHSHYFMYLKGLVKL